MFILKGKINKNDLGNPSPDLMSQNLFGRARAGIGVNQSNQAAFLIPEVRAHRRTA